VSAAELKALIQIYELSLQDLAGLLSVNYVTIYRWLKQEKIQTDRLHTTLLLALKLISTNGRAVRRVQAARQRDGVYGTYVLLDEFYKIAPARVEPEGLAVVFLAFVGVKCSIAGSNTQNHDADKTDPDECHVLSRAFG
jgi:hypothetical protein